MSDCERFPQIAQDKSATVSESLRSLGGNEQMSDSLKKCWLKKSKILFYYVWQKVFKKKIPKKWVNRSFLLISSFLVSDVSESLISLKSNEQCEWIAHFGHQKWVTMSDLLRLIRGNERCEQIAHFAYQKWANERIAHFFWANRSFAHFWTKNKRFAWKSNEQIPSPALK